MGAKIAQFADVGLWALARRQHGVLTRGQLLGAGLSARAVRHRLAKGRLHPVHTGVYAVGRAELSRLGQLMAAVLACGKDAVLSHVSAAEVLGIGPVADPIHVTVPPPRSPRPPGIAVHRRTVSKADWGTCRDLPVASPARTLCDLVSGLSAVELERAVNEADRLDLIDPEALRAAVERRPGRQGAPALKRLLDRRTFTLTRSELERRFKPIARAAGLPQPETEEWVNGFEVDFYWPGLRLVVETDGLRYHRTAAQQTRALERDQAHYAADFTPLRFSHAQIVYRRDYVRGHLERARQRIECERGV